MTIGEIVGAAFIGIGVFFSVVGIIGNIRMPDVYTRLHTSGKVSTVGIMSLLIGAGLLMPQIMPRAIVLILFLLITSPVAAHAIAAAAHRQGIPLTPMLRDDLATWELSQQQQSENSGEGA